MGVDGSVPLRYLNDAETEKYTFFLNIYLRQKKLLEKGRRIGEKVGESENCRKTVWWQCH